MSFPAHFLPQQTERLTLRRFTEVDLDRFLAYRHDPVVAQFQSWSMLSENEAIAFIHEMSAAPIGIPGEWFQIAIALQSSNQLIGDIGIQVSEHDTTTVEIGFTLHREEHGKGYAKEAIQALIHSLFELVTITKVIGITDSRNHPSINLLTRLGMKLISSEEIVFRNELCVEQTFELKKEDWLLYTTNELKPEYILDGRRTTTFEAFCKEVGQTLLAGQSWDENLDGFHAVLRGDYGYLPEEFRLVWREVNYARVALGYDETVRQLQQQLRDCPPTALIKTAWALRAALRRQGPTVFDWLVDAINKHPNVELVLVETTDAVE